MGAEAGEAYVALGVPADLDEAGGLALFTGIAEIAAETGTALAGGDVSAAPVITLAVTVVGHVESAERVVGRRGAEPGQVVCVTGELGGAAAGLMLSERPELRDAVSRRGGRTRSCGGSTIRGPGSPPAPRSRAAAPRR